MEEKRNHFSPPAGFRDYWNGDVKVREYIRAKLTKVFESYGYGRIELPLIERQSYFSVEMVGSNPWPGWHPKSLIVLPLKDYKEAYTPTADSQENYVLVPEGTTSFCRWVASDIENEGLFTDITNSIVKAFYILPCFRNETIASINANKQREFTQIGLEYLGVANWKADFEVIYLMYKSLQGLGFPQDAIRIRISDVRIFNFLIQKHNITTTYEYQLKTLLDNIASSKAKERDTDVKKYRKEFIDVLKTAGLTDESVNEWSLLTTSDYLNSVKALTAIPDEMGNIRADLTFILQKLEKLDVNVVADLSVVRSQEYYTAITFQADIFSDDIKVTEIAGGGRYDKFIGNFLRRSNSKIQREICGTGFAFSLERLVSVWQMLDIYISEGIEYDTRDERVDAVIFSQDVVKMFKHVDRLIKKKQRVEPYILDEVAANAEKYADALKVPLLKV